MFRNYLLLALRQLRKGRSYTVINIAGLAIGMAVALVIGIWITGELAVDKSYPDRSRIVEIMQDQRPNGTPPGSPITYRGMTVSSALEPYLQKNYKDVFAETALFQWPGDGLLANGDKTISRQGSWAEYTFPRIFGYRFLSGNAESLRDPSTALLSRSAAIALYGTENALGRTFKYNNQLTFTVRGIYADLPLTSSFHDIDFFIPVTHQRMDWLTHNTDFNNHSCRIFARLAGNTTAGAAAARIKDLCTPFVKYNIETYSVIPFDQLYLHYDSDSVTGSGRIGFVRLIGIIGVFVLLLACINFMNLSTARSEKRAREVGIRKTLGSQKHQLISQFLGESLLVAAFAFILAIGLTELSLPAFSQLAGKRMALPWADPVFWALSLGVTMVTGLLAGSYPAFYLSGFRPVKVLKGAFRAGRGASLPRKVLVVAQFAISVSLIIGTLVVFRQIQYAQDRPVGYDRAGLINIPINTDSLDRHFESLRTSLLNTGMVANVANASTLLTAFYQNNFMEWEGMTEEQKSISFRDIDVNADFGPTIGWTVLQGRDFSRARQTDSTAAIVNEEGARALGFKDPIGKTFRYNNKDWTIIGVTKDMISNSPYDKVQPAVFFGRGGHSVNIVRIKPGTPVRTALSAIGAVYKQYNPASPFIYHFNDDDYAQKFVTDTRIGSLTSVFTGLAILISCLGLFGLASFVAEQRTKEIGVRKVLGAGVVNLWALLSGDFLKLIVLAMAVAMPLDRAGHGQMAAVLPATYIPLALDLRCGRRRNAFYHFMHRELSGPQSRADESH
ncbi:ABC transporter permease [Puia sp. P3]|uniref:ABC transporter permease n=1 Tax=Puia sp. P3 TaxID=3423952 RepID=UPI003D66AC82